MTAMANQLPTAPAPIAALRDAGVSVWLDDLSRERLRSGNLQQLIDTTGIVGVTTNPSIFQACLLYTSPSPRDRTRSRMPSSA